MYLVTIPLRSTHGTGPQLIVMVVDDIPFTDTSVGAAVGAGKGTEISRNKHFCSTMRGRIKGTDSTINAILATAVLYELRWKIWNGAE